MVTEPGAPRRQSVLITAGDLEALSDNGHRYELVEGRLIPMPPTDMDHGMISSDLVTAVNLFVREHGLGRVLTNEPGFLLSRSGEPDTVLAPDVAFISAARLPPRGPHGRRGFPRLSPDLVGEVASPGPSRPELAAKAKLWLQAGVRLVWVIWPERNQVDVWDSADPAPPRTLGGSEDLEGGDVLPGFRYPLSQLWEPEEL